MSSNTCCVNILNEVNCPTPVTAGKAIWFKCRYASCHGGVGHVVITAGDGTVVYDDDPTTGTNKYVYIDFDISKVNALGATMDVTYKPGDAAWGRHSCSRATFDWGYVSNEQLVVDTAYLDNSGGANDLGNVCPTYGGGTRCNTFTIPIGAFSSITGGTPTTTPVGFYAKTRTVCFTGTPSCNNWTEIVASPNSGINFIAAGTSMVTIPAGKTAYIALINYNAQGISYTAPAADITIHDTASGQLLDTRPFILSSNNAAISPYPFDGRSIDGAPFKIENTWGVSVDVKAGPGIVNFPGSIYDGLAGIRVDDSLAYLIT